MDTLNRKLTKIKFSVFDKVKIKPSKADRELNQLYKRKPETLRNICSEKKPSKEQTSMKDPATNLLMFDSLEIK